LNKISEFQLENIFPNISIALRIFLSIPATVASAERSFSKRKLIKNYLKNTVTHDNLVDLTRLSIECNQFWWRQNFCCEESSEGVFLNKWKLQFLHSTDFLLLTAGREGAQNCLVLSNFNPLGGRGYVTS